MACRKNRGFYLLVVCLRTLKISYEYIEGFLRYEVPKWLKFRKFVLPPQKGLGKGGWTYPTVGWDLLPRYVVCTTPPYISLPRFFVKFFFKNVKNWTIFWGGIAQPVGRNSKKWKKLGRGFFGLKRWKKFVRHSDDGNPPKTPCLGVPTPKFFWNSLEFWGTPIWGSLIGFGSKVVAVGAPKKKINLASPTP